MSQDNVETIRCCDAAMSRGDADSYLHDIHADVENSVTEIAEVRADQLVGRVFDVVEEGRFEIYKMQDVDQADLVIYGIRLLGRARHTRLEIDIPGPR